MLATPGSELLVTNFAAQWLYLRNFPEVSPDFIVFLDFDEAPRRETELFFESIVREDRSVLGPLTADHTFMNERLRSTTPLRASTADGSRCRRTAPAAACWGQGSILAVTGYATRTSPVARGKWILGEPAGNAVAAGAAQRAAAERGEVGRRALDAPEHGAAPAQPRLRDLPRPDGSGRAALENFDAIGRWRTLTDGFEPIYASGSFPDGTTFYRTFLRGVRATLALPLLDVMVPAALRRRPDRGERLRRQHGTSCSWSTSPCCGRPTPESACFVIAGFNATLPAAALARSRAGRYAARGQDLEREATATGGLHPRVKRRGDPTRRRPYGSPPRCIVVGFDCSSREAAHS